MTSTIENPPASPKASQSEPSQSKSHASVEVISDATSLVPGNPRTLALIFTIQEGWHLYKPDPVSPGMEPKLELKAPAGITAGPLRFPPAVVHNSVAGDEQVYYSSVVLLVDLTVDPNLSLGQSVELELDVRWVACTEDQCITESKKLTLSLPVNASADPVRADEFAKWQEVSKPVE
jgi:thiol:disulfide interchange protein DsbD